MVSIAKLSSRGQIVIPQDIREKLKLEEGNLVLISNQDNSICLKKIELPKLKNWAEATKPFMDAAKKTNFSNEDLERVIAESRLSPNKK